MENIWDRKLLLIEISNMDNSTVFSCYIWIFLLHPAHPVRTWVIGFSSQLASAVSMGREDTSLIMLSVSFSKDNLWKDQISLTRKLLKVRVEEGEKRERGKKKRGRALKHGASS